MRLLIFLVIVAVVAIACAGGSSTTYTLTNGTFTEAELRQLWALRIEIAPTLCPQARQMDDAALIELTSRWYPEDGTGTDSIPSLHLLRDICD